MSTTNQSQHYQQQQHHHAKYGVKKIKREGKRPGKKQTTNINIANNIIKILLHVVSRVQDKDKGRWLTKKQSISTLPTIS